MNLILCKTFHKFSQYFIRHKTTTQTYLTHNKPKKRKAQKVSTSRFDLDEPALPRKKMDITWIRFRRVIQFTPITRTN